ncbi:MAG: hypothetical protein AAFN70_14960, partial [Planctomycetota bacterium]
MAIQPTRRNRNVKQRHPMPLSKRLLRTIAYRNAAMIAVLCSLAFASIAIGQDFDLPIGDLTPGEFTGCE